MSYVKPDWERLLVTPEQPVREREMSLLSTSPFTFPEEEEIITERSLLSTSPFVSTPFGSRPRDYSRRSIGTRSDRPMEPIQLFPTSSEKTVCKRESGSRQYVCTSETKSQLGIESSSEEEEEDSPVSSYSEEKTVCRRSSSDPSAYVCTSETKSQLGIESSSEEEEEDSPVSSSSAEEELQVLRSRSPLQRPAILRRRSRTVQLSHEEEYALQKFRDQDEADRRWLTERGVVPARVDLTRTKPILENTKAAEITTPSPFKDAYEIGRQLGKGSDGYVYDVTDRVTKASYAAKIVYISNQVPMYSDRFPLEAKIMVSLRNVPHVPKLERFFIENEMTIGGKYVYPSFVMVMTTPTPPFGSLSRFKKFSDFKKLTRTVLSQIATILRDLDDNNVCHMDLYSENILISATPSANANVIDFGRAQYKNVPYTYQDIDTYAAFPGSPPELRLTERNFRLRTPIIGFRAAMLQYREDMRNIFDYDRQTVWSFARTIFELFDGEVFYEQVHLDPSQLVKYPVSMPPMVVDLLRKVFVPYQRRIGLREMLDHPYFNLSVSE